jgi:hypothetical protein
MAHPHVPNYSHVVLIKFRIHVSLISRSTQAEHVAYLRVFIGATTVHTAYDHRLSLSYNAIGTPSISIHHIGQLPGHSVPWLHGDVRVIRIIPRKVTNAHRYASPSPYL